MSVVKFEQETLAVVTELADEEICAVVGGAYTSTYGKSGSSASGYNAQSSSQQANVVANGGKYGDTNATSIQSSNQTIDNSQDRAYVNYGYPYYH